MEFRLLEIKVMSAKDLKNVNFFFKMDVYAEVSINWQYRTKQTTWVDKHCGRNPKWNYTMKFTIDEADAYQNRLNLDFCLISKRLLGDKVIGTVQVPIKELLDQNKGNEKVEKNVSYSVRLPNGKAKGNLNFSYKFGDKFKKPAPAPPVPGAESRHVKKHGKEPAVVYPPPPTSYARPSSGQPPPPRAHPPAATGHARPSSGHHPPPRAHPPRPTGHARPSSGRPPPRGHPPPPPKRTGYPYSLYPQYEYQLAPAPGYGYPPQGGSANPKKSGVRAGHPPVPKPKNPKKSGIGARHPPVHKPQAPKNSGRKSTSRWA